MLNIDNLTKAIVHSRQLREKYLADSYRPGFHFAMPEDFGLPGDPNGAFYANGRYHLMYLYSCRSDGYRWGHISSKDLLHWRAHPDALIPDELDHGIFSGGAFLDDDGICYLTYWSLPHEGRGHGGIRIAKSCDPFFEKWEKFSVLALEGTEFGVIESKNQKGETAYIACADPSNIWKKGKKYYMQTGNLILLKKFKKAGHYQYTEDEIKNTIVPENIKGDWVDLFESEDLINWKYLHRFYSRKDIWTAENEDDMCPSFLPLSKSKNGGKQSGKYLHLFISHNRGCQYYIGEYDEKADLFYPETHGRMSWVDNSFFAPEALVDGQGRQIMWSWIQDNPADETENGWSGIFCMPRTLWLLDDNTLGIAPVSEFESLRYNSKKFNRYEPENGKMRLDGINGTSCEIKIIAEVSCGEVGLYVRASDDLAEYVKISYCHEDKKLVFDSRNGGTLGRPVLERAPFELKQGEKLEMTVFIDKNVIEAFVNDRQAIARRAYPKNESDGVFVFSTGKAKVEDITVHEIDTTNFY